MSAVPITHRRSGCLWLGLEVRVGVRVRVRVRVSVRVRVRVRARVGIGWVPLVAAREVAAAHDDDGAPLCRAARGCDERGDRRREVLEGVPEGAVLLAVEGHLG